MYKIIFNLDNFSIYNFYIFMVPPRPRSTITPSNSVISVCLIISTTLAAVVRVLTGIV